MICSFPSLPSALQPLALFTLATVHKKIHFVAHVAKVFLVKFPVK